MTGITIATSIVPRNFELQRAAIDSWLQLGFKVVSLNSAEEAAIVSQYFPDIPVKIAKRSAESITGKPYVFLDDIFSVLLEEKSDICGIVNSDIHLIARGDIQDFLCKNAAGNIIFGGRIDIESLDSLIGEEYYGGFDFFFFDRSLISMYPKTNFCLGAPWWDYWAPLLPMVKDVPVKQLITPFAYHLNHPIKWSQNLFEDFGLMFADYLLRVDSNKMLEQQLRNAAENAAGNSWKQIKDNVPLALCVLYYLKEKSEKISYISPCDSEKKIESTVREDTERKERLVFFQTQFCQMFNLLKAREDISVERIKSLHQSKKNLQEIHNSWSWRLTAPLRWITKRLLSKKVCR